jgi:hypothetical protein
MIHSADRHLMMSWEEREKLNVMARNSFQLVQVEVQVV